MQASFAGYHVVALAYPSSISISKFKQSADENVFLAARENIIHGTPFPELGVNKDNCIINRLTKLIVFLNTGYPNEGWGQYLTSETKLVWENFVIAGQSQGGGHAAVLAMQYTVSRVLMLGSPKDFNTYVNKPARWLLGHNSTPLDRYFSFVHCHDSNGSLTKSERYIDTFVCLCGYFASFLVFCSLCDLLREWVLLHLFAFLLCTATLQI